MHLPTYLVSQLRPLQHHVVVLADAEVPCKMLDSCKRGRSTYLKDRGAKLIQLDTKPPKSTRCRLFVIPKIGPCPLLPPGWTVIRAHLLIGYCEHADVQAYVFQALGLRLPFPQTFPLPHHYVADIVKQNRPETEAMAGARFYLRHHISGYPPIPEEGEWLLSDYHGPDVDYEGLNARDCLVGLLHTTNISGSDKVVTHLQRKRPRDDDAGENNSRQRRKTKRALARLRESIKGKEGANIFGDIDEGEFVVHRFLGHPGETWTIRVRKSDGSIVR